MNVTCKASELKAALKWAGTVSTGTSHIPELSGVRIDADPVAMGLTASNGQVTAEVRVEGIAHEPGSVVAPRRFYEVVGRLPNDAEVEIVTVEDALELRAGSIAVSMPTLDVESWPPKPNIAETLRLLITEENADRLNRIGQVRSHLADKPQYMGVGIVVEDGDMHAYGLDDPRSAWAYIGLAPPGVEDMSVSLNAEAVEAAAKRGAYKLLIDGQVAVFEGNDGWRITSTHAAGAFPSLAKIHTVAARGTIQFDRATLEDALGRAGSVREKNVVCEFDVDAGSVALLVSEERDTYSEMLTVDTDEAWSTYLNPQMLARSLRLLSDDRVELRFHGRAVSVGDAKTDIQIVMGCMDPKARQR